MSEIYIELQAIDPIIARDGRPFGVNQGRRMRSLDWPLPSLVAGSLRTAIVKASKHLDFSGDVPRLLMQVEVAGALPMTDGSLCLPAPADCIYDGGQEGVGRILCARPQTLAPGEGVDMPGGLMPVCLAPEQAAGSLKAASAPAWWPAAKYAEWLVRPEAQRDGDWFTGDFLTGPEQELRDHVCLNPDRGAAAEGLIYMTAGLRLTHLPRFGDKRGFPDGFASVAIAVRVTNGQADFAPVLGNLNMWHPLGGERRLIHWSANGSAEAWKCPEQVAQALAKNPQRVRMVLATPAIFSAGWRPGWLDESTLEGIPPFADAPKLRLKAVSISRWRAVSGWSYQPVSDGAGRAKPGPKPVRRMVPAGGVYFFEIVEGNAASLADRGWLRPVSDDEQERRDGFGLAVWGLWH